MTFVKMIDILPRHEIYATIPISIEGPKSYESFLLSDIQVFEITVYNGMIFHRSLDKILNGPSKFMAGILHDLIKKFPSPKKLGLNSTQG